MATKVLAGRDELFERIGEGGMSVVYKAKDKLDALVGRIGNDVLQKLLKETPKDQPKHKEESL